jgi:hypothetical protein
VTRPSAGTVTSRRPKRLRRDRRDRVPVTVDQRIPGPYPYYRASGQVDSVDGFLLNEDLSLEMEDGAGLGNPSQALAYRVSGKCWVNNHAHVLRTKHVNGDFLTHYLDALDRNYFLSGSTREMLTRGDMNRIPTASDGSTRKRSSCDALLGSTSSGPSRETISRGISPRQGSRACDRPAYVNLRGNRQLN